MKDPGSYRLAKKLKFLDHHFVFNLVEFTITERFIDHC